MNGRRVVYGGSGANSAVDLNMIPTSMIERMEVLKDGASALYGADAVAGVVNIVTKRDFDGLAFDSKYGQTSRGDGDEFSGDLTFGMNGDRGNLTAALSYVETEDVNMADREPCGYGVSGTSFVCVGTSNTPGGRATYLTGPNTGSRINFNQVPGGNGNFFEPYSSASHDVDYFQWLNAVSPVKKTTFSLMGHYDLSDNVRLITEAIYYNRKTDQIATPATLQTYYQPGVGRVNFNIPANHHQPDRPVHPPRSPASGRDWRPQHVPGNRHLATRSWPRRQVRRGLALGHLRQQRPFDRHRWLDQCREPAARLRDSVQLQRYHRSLRRLFGRRGYLTGCINYFMFTQRDTGGNEQASLECKRHGLSVRLASRPRWICRGRGEPEG